VLYLDYDGVLHPDDAFWHPRRGPYLRDSAGHRLFEHANLLADLLGPYPELRIVLSTSWVRALRYSRAKRYLPSALQARVIGSTWHSEKDPQVWLQLSRGEQVLADVQRRRPRAWLAIDDDPQWPAAAAAHLVLSDSTLGISAPGVQQQLEFKLAEAFGRSPGQLPALVAGR
jgi:hypothetical protein